MTMFRGAETYAAFRSVVSTAKANSASVLDTVRCVLSRRRNTLAESTRRSRLRWLDQVLNAIMV
jgi:hypothetical protein